MKREIGKRIQNIRENMNLTKEAFAKEIGISGQYLGLVEHGKNYLSTEKLKVLCDFTNLSADYILFGKNPASIKEFSNLLSGFTDEQIDLACKTIKDIAIFIKNSPPPM